MTVTLSDLLAGIRERKAALGIVDSDERTESMRNRGGHRTAAKRTMLERIENRALAAGLNPLGAYY